MRLEFSMENHCVCHVVVARFRHICLWLPPPPGGGWTRRLFSHRAHVRLWPTRDLHFAAASTAQHRLTHAPTPTARPHRPAGPIFVDLPRDARHPRSNRKAPVTSLLHAPAAICHIPSSYVLHLEHRRRCLYLRRIALHSVVRTRESRRWLHEMNHILCGHAAVLISSS